jgi:hypothetical protein
MPLLLHQRIYDNGLGQYVIYAKYAVDTAPAAAETTPNYTGSLVTASHETYKVEYVDPLFHASDADTQGLWQFDGGLTAVVGNALTVDTGTARYTPAAVPDSQALASDGGLYLDQAHDSNLAITGALTIQVLVRPHAIEATFGVIVGFMSSAAGTANNDLYQLRFGADNTLSYTHQDSGEVYRDWDTDIVVPTGEWSHITLTRAANGVDLELFVNEVSRGTTTLAAAPSGGGSSVLGVADFPSGTFSPVADISSIKINDAVMADADIIEASRRTMPTYLSQSPF